MKSSLCTRTSNRTPNCAKVPLKLLMTSSLRTGTLRADPELPKLDEGQLTINSVQMHRMIEERNGTRRAATYSPLRMSSELTGEQRQDEKQTIMKKTTEGKTI